MMAVSTHVLLLLVLHVVSALQKESHFYHISTVHFSPFQTTSAELPVAVWTDDENLDSEGTQELFIHLLEIIYNSTEHAERNICEIERSSRGAVTLPNSTSDHRHTALYWTPTDDTTVQCVVMDSDVPLDEEDSPSLSQVSRDYLVQRCMERIITGHYVMDGRRAAEATGPEDDFWFTEVLDEVTDWVVSHLDRIMFFLTGFAFWGIHKQDVIIVQIFFILMINNEDRIATYCIFLNCIMLCERFYGLDLIVVHNIAVWAICNQDLIILTAFAVLVIYNLNPDITNDLFIILFFIQVFFVCCISIIWEVRYYVYGLALLVIHTENQLLAQSIALCAVYNQDRIILSGIAALVIYYQHKKLLCPVTFVLLSSGLDFSECFDLSSGIRSILSVFSRIKKKIKKVKAAKSPSAEATREHRNDLQMDEDQGGEDTDQIETNFCDGDEGQNRLTAGLNPAGRRFAASMDIPLTLAGDDDDGDKGQNRLVARLTPAGRRFAASMDIPLTLANVYDGDEGWNRLTAGLNPAGRRMAASMDIPLTLAERTESFDQ